MSGRIKSNQISVHYSHSYQLDSNIPKATKYTKKARLSLCISSTRGERCCFNPTTEQRRIYAVISTRSGVSSLMLLPSPQPITLGRPIKQNHKNRSNNNNNSSVFSHQGTWKELLWGLW